MRDFEKDFHKWLVIDFAENHIDNPYSFINNFDKLPFSMQWGVYVDFFDEHGIFMEAEFYWGGILFKSEVYEQFYCGEDKCTNLKFEQEEFKTRQEARKEVLEKAKEIYNNKI